MREYNGSVRICVLMSCDYSDLHGESIWTSTMNAVHEMDGDLRVFGGQTTVYNNEDLDGLIKVGNILDLIDLSKYNVAI